MGAQRGAEGATEVAQIIAARQRIVAAILIALFPQFSEQCAGMRRLAWSSITMTREIGKVFRTHDAADYCGSSASTFEKLRLTGGGPVYTKLGRRVVYRVEDLDAWLAANRRRSTSDPGQHA